MLRGAAPGERRAPTPVHSAKAGAFTRRSCVRMTLVLEYVINWFEKVSNEIRASLEPVRD
jgi:hypothetical protein